MTNQRAEEIAARSRGGSFRDDTQRFHGAPTFGYVARHRQEAFRLAGRVSYQADHHIPPFGCAALRRAKAVEAATVAVLSSFQRDPGRLPIPPEIDPG